MSCSVYAWIAIGDSSDTPRGFADALVAEGWPHINGDIQTATIALGPSRVIVWLPHGHDEDGPYDLGAVTAVGETPGLELLADESAFVTAWVAFFIATGINEIGFYLGYPGAYAARWSGLTTPQKNALIATNHAPYLAVRDALAALGHPNAVRIVYDTYNAHWEGDDRELLGPYITSEGFPAGGEPWMAAAHPNVNDPNWLTVVLDVDIPDFEGAGWAAVYPWAGPVCPYVVGVEATPAIERARAAIARFDNVAVQQYVDFTAREVQTACAGYAAAGGIYFGEAVAPDPPKRWLKPGAKRRRKQYQPDRTPPGEPVFLQLDSLSDAIDGFTRRAARSLRDAVTRAVGSQARVVDGPEGLAVEVGGDAMAMEFGTESRRPTPWALSAIEAAGAGIGGGDE